MITRRKFLQASLGLVATPYLAEFAFADRLDLTAIRRLTDLMTNQLIDSYTCIVHPEAWSYFVSIHKRGQWGNAYRRWRKEGKPEPDSAQSIWERFADKFDPEAFAGNGEIGRVDNFRFIVSDKIEAFQR